MAPLHMCARVRDLTTTLTCRRARLIDPAMISLVIEDIRDTLREKKQDYYQIPASSACVPTGCVSQSVP